MHETAVMQGMMRTVLDCLRQSGAARVTNVQLVLGASSHFTADIAYRQFEAMTKGTPLEDASLTIEWLPATYQCLTCERRFESAEPSAQVICPQCGDVALETDHQDVCFVSAIDVAYGDEELPERSLLTEYEPGDIPAHILASECSVSQPAWSSVLL